jgi:hypothetical protein
MPTLTPLEVIQDCTPHIADAITNYHQNNQMNPQDPNNPSQALRTLHYILNQAPTNLNTNRDSHPLPRVPTHETPGTETPTAESEPIPEPAPDPIVVLEPELAPYPTVIPQPHEPPLNPNQQYIEPAPLIHLPPPQEPPEPPANYLVDPHPLPPQTPLRRSQRGYHPSQKHLEAFGFSTINADTGLPTEYRQLLASSQGHLWEQGALEEWARLAQGLPAHNITIEEETNTIRCIPKHQVPPSKTPTYPRIVVTNRPNKASPIRFRVTVGGDRIQYPDEVSTEASNLATVKLLLSSIISTPGAKWMSIDIKDFYLKTTMSRFEYMRVPITLFPKAVIDTTTWKLVSS